MYSSWVVNTFSCKEIKERKMSFFRFKARYVYFAMKFSLSLFYLVLVFWCLLCNEYCVHVLSLSNNGMFKHQMFVFLSITIDQNVNVRMRVNNLWFRALCTKWTVLLKTKISGTFHIFFCFALFFLTIFNYYICSSIAAIWLNTQ